jgi:hypothetical protein
MMRHISLGIVLVSLLGACATLSPSRLFTRAAYPDMFAALDNSPDGHSGIISTTGETFKIKSSYVNSERLCRLVEIRGTNAFFGESFCKAKGGEWR